MTTILIVEDDAPISNLLKERLEDEGFQTKTAFTVGEGMARIKEARPDVITLDIILPDNSGLDMLRMIKKDPDTFTIPVVIISACDEENTAKSLGAEEYIQKPVNFFKLLGTIKQCVREGK